MKKIKSKKLLSLIVAIVMVIGLLPLDAFASDDNQIVTNGQEQTTDDGSVIHSKMISQTDTNEFDITLTVQTKEEIKEQTVSADAAVVLVMDVSNSMKETVDGRQPDDESEMRITQAKAAAKNFIDSFGTDAEGATRKVSVVEFGSSAYTVQGWTDTATAKSAVDNVGINFRYPACSIEGEHTHDVNTIEWGGFFNLQWRCNVEGCKYYKADTWGGLGWYTLFDYGYNGHTHEQTFDGPHGDVLTDGGGTNIEGGLKLADNLLNSSAVSEIDNRYVVLITDGVPTYHVYQNRDNSSMTFIEGQAGGGSYAARPDYQNVPTVANAIKEDATLYTVSYASERVHDTVGGQQIDAWLTSFANKNIVAGDNIDWGLGQVSEIIQNQAKAWILTDPIPAPYITFDFAKNSNVANSQVNPDAVLQYDPAKGVLTWNLKSETPVDQKQDGDTTWYTYRATYHVSLDTAAQGFVEGQAYATNGNTTLTYMLTKDGELQSDLKTAVLTVPTVKGEIPSVEYVIHCLYKDKTTGKYVEEKTVKESAKLWSQITINSDSYNKDNYYFVSGDNGAQTLTPDNLEFTLKYDPISANVVVKHWVSQKNQTDGGVQYTEPKCQDTDTYNCYQGDTFTNEKFLNADQYTLEKSIQVNGTTYTTDNYQNITLPGGQTVLNLYYTTAGEDQRTPVDYEIHYWYRTDSWKLNAEGKYEKVTGTYTEAEGETVTAEGYHGTTVTAPDKAGECKLDTEKTPSTSLKLDKNGTNRLDIYYYKEAPEAPEFGTATLTIRHVYKQETPDGIVEVPEDNWTECENKTVYVGETWYATPNLKDGYTLKTLASDFTVKIDEADKAYEIVVEYYKDVRQPAEVVINHHYTTYTWTVDAATGEGKYVETGSEDLNGVHATGEWYAGQKFTPAQIPNGYTYVRGGDEKVLTSGLNTFDLYYETYVGSEANEADVTINHIYETYVSYVDDNGNVIRDQLQGEPTAESETHYGKVGDVIEATKQEKDGFTFYQADTDDLKVTLQGAGGQYNLHYKKTIDELGSQYPVTVQPIYKTYRMYVNADGQIVTELTNTENGTPVDLGQFYAKQKVTAVAADYAKTGFAFDAEAAENTEGLSVTVSAEGSNTIQIVYKQVNDQRGLPGVVMVNNVYTTVTKYVANGEVKTSEETVVGSNTSYGPYYVGQFFDTTGKSTEWAGYQLDTNKTQPAAQVKIDGETTQITFYWVREVDHTSPATVKVIHHYTINDANPFGNSSSWTVGEDDKPLTGYYQGQYYLAHYDFQDGRFTQEHVTEVVPSEAATEPGTILQGQTNEIHIYYVKNVDTRVPSSVKVVHSYYADEAALEAGTVEATFEEHYDKMEADVYTAALRTEHNGLAYEFHSATPENYTITVVADAEKNVINISYVRAQVTYTVAHEYYTNDAMSGRTVVELTGKVGDVIKAEDIDKVTSFEGNTYTYTSASADSITLTNGENAIVLRYDRTTSSGGGGGSTTSYYKVTVNYYDADGNKIADSFVSSNIRRGGSWDFSDKQLETITVGDVVYTFSHADGDPITGSDIRSNQVVNLYYAAETDIDDGDTPLDPGPGGETGEPGDGTGTGDGGEVDIDDGDTPLDPGPGGETGGETNIDDGEVPQAGLPQTGAAMATVNPGLAAGILALAATMAFGGIAYTVRRKKEEDAQ